jgi:hypothetical protein
VAKRGLLCVVGFALSVQADDDSAKFARLAGVLGALACGAVWCCAAFAQWLTREDEECANK